MYDVETLEKYAEVMLWGLSRGRKEPFSKSDFILIQYDLDGLPLAEEICAKVHDMGYIPIPRAAMTPRMEYDRLTKSNNKRLSTLIPGERDLYNHLHGVISVIAPASLTHLAGVDAEILTLSQQARQPIRTIMQTREDMGTFGWTLCMYPTKALAGQAGLTIEQYARSIARACLLTEADPVVTWKRLVKQSEEIRSWLDSLGAVQLHIESDSTDLRLGIGAMRRWQGITGRNIPSFEVYVSPDYRTVEGVYTADLPSFRSGQIVQNIRLEFSAGRCVTAKSERAQEFVIRQLNMDQGASQVGEFALVDKRFSPIDAFMANTLYDENHGGQHGSMHIALGNAYSNTFSGPSNAFTTDERKRLGFNSSALHWDLVNTEQKRVTARLADGSTKTIYENGQFTL